jgi:DNA-binding NtrC family response regulator
MVTWEGSTERSGYPGPCLLVFLDNTTRRIDLPADGEFRIGAASGCQLRLDDCPCPVALSLRLSNGMARVDTCAAGLVRINDEPLAGPRPLLVGDTLTIGQASLIFQGSEHSRPRRTASGIDELLHRLAVETLRSSRNGRPLALLALDLQVPISDPTPVVDAINAEIRVVDQVSWDGQAELLLLLPDTGLDARRPASRILAALQPLAPRARVGLAICPTDATTADALVSGARRAAQAADPGQVAALSLHVHSIQAGPLGIVAADPTMLRLLALVRRLAPTQLPVLIVGETGVGKEVMAQALHYWSDRHARPLVTINCAAITESLFESELFGHVRGAFTGASDNKAGLLESAEGGTAFLDEIGECPMGSQVKLLRAIETRRIARVGSVTERSVDIRVVAATNRDLDGAVERKAFRQDLFFRLNTAVVHVPPLRQRPLDIPVLARTFLERACQATDRPAMSFSSESLRRLLQHSWPGNVRELRNVVEFCVATADGPVVEAVHLPEQVVKSTAPWLAARQRPDAVTGYSGAGSASPFLPFSDRPFPSLRDELRELERTRMLQALESTGGVRNKAAALLGMPLRTFVTRLKEYGIAPAPPHQSGRS